MRDGTRRVLALAKRNGKEILRDPVTLVFMLALPLVMELLFYFIFHSMTDQFEMKNLAPGIAAFSQAFLTLFTGILIAVDRCTSFLTRLFVSGAKPHEFILGYALTMLPISLAQSVLFFIVGGIFDPALFCARMILCVLMCAVTSLLFIGLGILFGSICSEKSVGGICSIVISGQSLLSGMWFPTEGLSGGFITLMKWLPFKNASDLLRNLLNGTDDAFKGIWLPLIILLAYTIVIFVLAVAAFRKKMKAQ